MPDTVVPPALPPAAAVDIGAVRAVGDRLTPLGRPVADLGDRTVRSWRQVGSYYVAPETPVLLAALDPLLPHTDRTAYRITGLGTALTTYADMAEPIIVELRRLAAAGRVTPEEAARMTELADRLALVEEACAAAIRRLAEPDLRPVRVRVGEEVETGEATLSVGILSLDSGATFKVTTFDDGTVHVTALSGGGLGIQAGVGKLVELGGGVTVRSGSTWRFQDGAEASRMLDDLRRYVEQRQRPAPAGKGAFPVAALVRPPRPPDTVITEAGLEASAEGSLDGQVAKAGGALAGGIRETVTRDMALGLTTSVLSAEGSVSVDGTFRPVGVGPGGSLGGEQKIELGRGVVRDHSGRVVRVQLTETRTGTEALSVGGTGPGDASGGRHRPPDQVDPGGAGAVEWSDSRVTVTTTTLEVTDGNRALVEDWVARGRPDLGTPAGYALTHRPDVAVPGDEFQNLLHREARVSDVTYDQGTASAGIEAEIRAGGTFGAEVGDEETSARAVRSSHLGAPGPDGVRRSVPDPEDVPR